MGLRKKGRGTKPQPVKIILSAEHCSADDSGVVAECCAHNARLLHVSAGEAETLYLLVERAQQILALTRNSAADAYYLRLQDVHQRDHFFPAVFLFTRLGLFHYNIAIAERTAKSNRLYTLEKT